MQVRDAAIRLGTLGGYPSPLLKQGESHPQTPIFVDAILPTLIHPVDADSFAAAIGEIALAGVVGTIANRVAEIFTEVHFFITLSPVGQSAALSALLALFTLADLHARRSVWSGHRTVTRSV